MGGSSLCRHCLVVLEQFVHSIACMQRPQPHTTTVVCVCHVYHTPCACPACLRAFTGGARRPARWPDKSWTSSPWARELHAMCRHCKSWLVGEHCVSLGKWVRGMHCVWHSCRPPSHQTGPESFPHCVRMHNRSSLPKAAAKTPAAGSKQQRKRKQQATQKGSDDDDQGDDDAADDQQSGE